MKRSHRTLWWTAYGVGCAAVVAALGWVSSRVIQLQRDEALARAEVRMQDQTRQALWRMDSWLAPRLAREAGRTWFEYESYYPQTMAYNRMLEPFSEGTVVLPSPLLNFESDILPLHFQYRERTGFSSPQVPAAVYLTSDTVGCSPVPADPKHTARLADFCALNQPAELAAQIDSAEKQLAASMSEDAPVEPQGEQTSEQLSSRQQGGQYVNAKVSQQQWRQMQQEAAVDLKARRSNVNTAKQQTVNNDDIQGNAFQKGEALAVPQAASVQVGPLVPFWLGDPPTRLMLARRVRLSTEELLQGVEVDWGTLKAQLLATAADVMPGATLRPVLPGEASNPAMTLASLPVVLEPPVDANASVVTANAASYAGLGLMWLVAIGALSTTGFALRSTIASAVQTSRFASSVTHELRTPLTTFRLYAEMLSDGMVKDDEQKRSYLHTLRDESGRLGFLVENVLTWSRVEEGRSTVEPRRMSADELVSAAEPVLRRRCEEAGATFTVQLSDDPVDTSADGDRVRQVLFNLVDNACKYAGQHAMITLSSQHRGSDLVLAVDDNGPGVPEHLRKQVFNAFDRGTRGPGDTIRGLGLGLAISRELARSLGGELKCTTSALGGARFELILPVLK